MPVLKNARHERFAQFVAQGKTLVEAHELAGFKVNDGNCSTLHNRPDIQERLKELKERIVKKTVITAEYLTERLNELALEARDRGQLSAAVSAIDKMAKINGFGLERAQVNVTNNVPQDAESLRKALLEHVLARKSDDSDDKTIQ